MISSSWLENSNRRKNTFQEVKAMKLLKKRLIFLGLIFMLLFIAAAVSSSVAPADKVAIHSADPFAAKSIPA